MGIAVLAFYAQHSHSKALTKPKRHSPATRSKMTPLMMRSTARQSAPRHKTPKESCTAPISARNTPAVPLPSKLSHKQLSQPRQRNEKDPSQAAPQQVVHLGSRAISTPSSCIDHQADRKDIGATKLGIVVWRKEWQRRTGSSSSLKPCTLRTVAVPPLAPPKSPPAQPPHRNSNPMDSAVEREIAFARAVKIPGPK